MTAEEIIKDKIIELYHKQSQCRASSALARLTSEQVKVLEEVLEKIKEQADEKR